MATVVWDPFGTIGQALWIGGAQWAGKSTVARILAKRYGLTAYHYDYHDARGHQDRHVAARARSGDAVDPPDPEWMWVTRSPRQMADEVIDGFPARFEWALDDLRALVSGRPLIAEGWGLRPELVAPLLAAPRRMVVMVPTEEFRRHQLRALARAGSLGVELSDPELGQRNRIERDRLVACDAVESARQHGVRVLDVDGSQDAERVADAVADEFAPFLPSRAPARAPGINQWRRTECDG
ncbi:hypothetical protein [Phytoactinopolyspora endophytica]|uniref:hypothetical protein n=1 Tax=Phytoactinopolyspora endophytica TaxID=1642495 RepID=UPI00101C2CD2|nr:hypothetical protein [Phytoactinopolyspora endophytica]